MRDLEHFEVWERSHRPIVAVYKATVASTQEKLYVLASQRGTLAPLHRQTSPKGGTELARKLPNEFLR